MARIVFFVLAYLLVCCVSPNTDSKNTENYSFLLNFNEPKTLIYTFEQQADLEVTTDREVPLKKSKVLANGKLIMEINTNNLADITLSDIENKVINYKSDGTASGIKSGSSFSQNFQNMSNDGIFNPSIIDIGMSVMFALPSDSLSIHQKVEIPLEFSMDLFGEKLVLKGTKNVEFSGFKEIGSRNCAVLQGTIDIKGSEVPPSLKGKFDGVVSGIYTGYFDVKNGICVGIDFKDNVSNMFVDLAKKPHTSIKENVTKTNRVSIYSDSKTNSQFKIRLEKVEE